MSRIWICLAVALLVFSIFPVAVPVAIAPLEDGGPNHVPEFPSGAETLLPLGILAGFAILRRIRSK